MKDKEKIKQEIERRIYFLNGMVNTDFGRGVLETLNKLKHFIDSLPEEIGCEKKDYRERYKRIVQTEQFKKTYCGKSLGKEEPASEELEEAVEKYSDNASNIIEWSNGWEDLNDCEYVERAFKAGAEWQRKKDQETIELAEDHAMLAGMEKMREEMMKNAVDCDVFKKEDNMADLRWKDNTAFERLVSKFNDGDKVQLIIIKRG